MVRTVSAEKSANALWLKTAVILNALHKRPVVVEEEKEIVSVEISANVTKALTAACQNVVEENKKVCLFFS